jgi:hypothetical protein
MFCLPSLYRHARVGGDHPGAGVQSAASPSNATRPLLQRGARTCPRASKYIVALIQVICAARSHRERIVNMAHRETDELAHLVVGGDQRDDSTWWHGGAPAGGEMVPSVTATTAHAAAARLNQKRFASKSPKPVARSR